MTFNYVKSLQDRIRTLEKRVRELEKVSHPPLGQDAIYDRLEKLEDKVKKIERPQDISSSSKGSWNMGINSGAYLD